MTLPDPATAEALLREAEAMNPGPWVQHSRNVALAAKHIAGQHPDLDPVRAHTLGLLHDIGRRSGPNGARHVIDGYDHLMGLGYSDAARIALTHSFAVKHVEALLGHRDDTPAERARLAELLGAVTFTDEDRLFQLCDILGGPEGFCFMQERLLDVTLRHGFTAYTQEKWRAQLDLKIHFDRVCGGNIYRLLPGLCERLLA